MDIKKRLEGLKSFYNSRIGPGQTQRSDLLRSVDPKTNSESESSLNTLIHQKDLL